MVQHRLLLAIDDTLSASELRRKEGIPDNDFGGRSDNTTTLLVVLAAVAGKCDPTLAQMLSQPCIPTPYVFRFCTAAAYSPSHRNNCIPHAR